MTKEEESIKELNKLVRLRKNKTTGKIKFDTCICATRDLETVLNLLKKKDRQLYERNNRIRNLEKECQQQFDAMMDTIVDNNKKNLMISLIAEQLTTPVHDKKWVIDYYKKKVEEC